MKDLLKFFNKKIKCKYDKAIILALAILTTWSAFLICMIPNMAFYGAIGIASSITACAFPFGLAFSVYIGNFNFNTVKFEDKKWFTISFLCHVIYLICYNTITIIKNISINNTPLEAIDWLCNFAILGGASSVVVIIVGLAKYSWDKRYLRNYRCR